MMRSKNYRINPAEINSTAINRQVLQINMDK